MASPSLFLALEVGNRVRGLRQLPHNPALSRSAYASKENKRFCANGCEDSLFV